MDSFKFHVSKRLNNFDKFDLLRAELQMELSRKLESFPKIIVVIRGTQLIKYSEIIKRRPFNTINGDLLNLWRQFAEQIDIMHSSGYIHGDILMKNIIYDGIRFRLIDHELRLHDGNELKVTYPWVHPSNLLSRFVSVNTDEICMKATFFRLFNYESYINFKNKQKIKLSEFTTKRNANRAKINGDKYFVNT
jgi:hypothetical protein